MQDSYLEKLNRKLLDEKENRYHNDAVLFPEDALAVNRKRRTGSSMGLGTKSRIN